MLIASAGNYIATSARERSFGAQPIQFAGMVEEPGKIDSRPVEPTHAARIVYDREAKRSFVEFLDPESGRVLTRFPADQRLDSVLEASLAQAGTSGNLLDIHA